MRAARVILWTLGVPLWVWAGAALFLFPGSPAAARWSGIALMVAATALALWKAPSRWRAVFVLGIAIAVALMWLSVSPAAERSWAAGQERVPRLVREGDFITIENVRHADWRSATDVDLHWETRRYDLRTLRAVDLVVEPFEDWRGPAHIFVTFRFADGEHVAISIEARREAGERYSAVRGAFRHYELLYLVGDERDLIGLRANIRRDPVYIFPTRASPAEARALFEAMLERAEALGERPEFYNTVTSTCATGLLRHVNALRERKVSRFDWRIAFPGYADELAWDLGWIDFEGTMEEARARFLINERSAFDPTLDGPVWSRKIRGLPTEHAATEISRQEED